jgi:hypothetical protein
MRGRDHVHRGISVLETESLTLSIPARCEGCETYFTARSFVISPPFLKLLVPSLRVPYSANADMHSPDGGVSLCWHRGLLRMYGESKVVSRGAVPSTNRLNQNIGASDQTVQRIVIIKIMNNIHVRNSYRIGADAQGI